MFSSARRQSGVACVCACVRACARACVRLRACVRACVCVGHDDSTSFSASRRRAKD